MRTALASPARCSISLRPCAPPARLATTRPEASLRTLAILPVKSFGAAKQRLAESLGAGSRQALAQAMFTDVLAALRRASGLDGVVVVTSDRSAEAAARADRLHVLADTARAGQSEAALI